jgi:hypothetical protein
MLVSFNFSGLCRGELLEVFDTLKLTNISVSTLSNDELKGGLNDGRYVINFADFYSQAGKVENEMTGFEVEEE